MATQLQDNRGGVKCATCGFTRRKDVHTGDMRRKGHHAFVDPRTGEIGPPADELLPAVVAPPEPPATNGRQERVRLDQPLSDRRSLNKAGSISTAQDLAELMTALMYDVLAGTVTPGEASAVINAGRQTLRLVELSLRYEVSGSTPLMSIATRSPRLPRE